MICRCPRLKSRPPAEHDNSALERVFKQLMAVHGRTREARGNVGEKFDLRLD